jgi:hypothetical protein
VAKWDQAIVTAASRPVPSRVSTVTVDARDHDRIAFLTDPADIDRVVAAVEDAVQRSRGKPPAK